MTILTRLAVRLVHVSTLVDRAARLFDRLRSRLVLALATDRFLDAYNDAAYARNDTYRPCSPAFRRTLFRWEEDAAAAFLPPPPARVLVGGAGGGREAFALADLGYLVVAFEPSRELAANLARAGRGNDQVRVYRSRYEDLPALEPLDAEGSAATLAGLGPFDAAVFGWSSFSHLRTERRRVEALRAVAAACDGPILVSFFGAAGQARDAFSAVIGFYHESDEDEIRRTADAARLVVRHLSMDARDGAWPHAILQRPPVVEGADHVDQGERLGGRKP